MTWTRFEAKARAHAKCVKAGNAAASFWAWAVMWSADNGTDGYLDGSLLGSVLPVPIANAEAKALADLCVGATIKPGGSGLFELAEGGYIIHDFHQFQPPADEDQKQAWLHEVRSKAGKKGAQARWQSDSKLDSKTNGEPSRARAPDRIGPDRIGMDPESDRKVGARRPDETIPAERVERNWPSGETGYDLALRIWDELWSAKYHGEYHHTVHTGPKSEAAALQKLGGLALARANGSPHDPETFVRHWVRAYLKDPDAWPSDNRHPIRGLESRLNKYGDPKKPKVVTPPKPEPTPEPARPFTPLPKVNGPAHVHKASTHDELKAKAEADKARLLAVEGKP